MVCNSSATYSKQRRFLELLIFCCGSVGSLQQRSWNSKANGFLLHFSSRHRVFFIHWSAPVLPYHLLQLHSHSLCLRLRRVSPLHPIPRLCLGEPATAVTTTTTTCPWNGSNRNWPLQLRHVDVISLPTISWRLFPRIFQVSKLECVICSFNTRQPVWQLMKMLIPMYEGESSKWKSRLFRRSQSYIFFRIVCLNRLCVCVSVECINTTQQRYGSCVEQDWYVRVGVIIVVVSLVDVAKLWSYRVSIARRTHHFLVLNLLYETIVVSVFLLFLQCRPNGIEMVPFFIPWREMMTCQVMSRHR